MKKLLTALFAASIGFGATMSHAGGPIVIDDKEEVIVTKPASSIGVLPVLIGIIVLCAIACNQDEDEPN